MIDSVCLEFVGCINVTLFALLIYIGGKKFIGLNASCEKPQFGILVAWRSIVFFFVECAVSRRIDTFIGSQSFSMYGLRFLVQCEQSTGN